MRTAVKIVNTVRYIATIPVAACIQNEFSAMRLVNEPK